MADRTNAERQRRYVARLKEKARAAVSNGTGAALVQALAQAKARIAELERESTGEREWKAAKAALRDNKDDRIAELEKEIEGLRLHIRFGPKRRAAEPKAAKPPLPPDEERDRQIKALRTEVRNLKAKLSDLTGRYEDAIEKVGGMPRESRIAIDKVLHPDQRKHASDADKDLACALWNSWKTSNGKASRR